MILIFLILTLIALDLAALRRGVDSTHGGDCSAGERHAWHGFGRR